MTPMQIHAAKTAELAIKTMAEAYGTSEDDVRYAIAVDRPGARDRFSELMDLGLAATISGIIKKYEAAR